MKTKSFKSDKIAYIYILPALAVFGFIYINPIIQMIRNSLSEWEGYKIVGFAGFDNFKELFYSTFLPLVLRNNLVLVICVIPVVIIIAIYFAQNIYLKIFGYQLYNFLFFLPVILPIIVIAKIYSSIFSKNGLINLILKNIGLDFLATDWIADTRFSLYTVILVIIWSNIGFAMILFLARLTTIDPAIYEAAKIDGASDGQLFFYISLPLLRPTIQIYSILTIIGLMSFMFGYIYVMTGGGPGFSSSVLEYYVYMNIIRFGKLGVGNAAAALLITITAILISIFTFLQKRQTYE